MPYLMNTRPCSRRVIEFSTDGAPGIILSAHGHNDLGLGVANSLAAIRGGARQLELTINGIGERAGNASLEEVAVALRVRQAILGVTTNLHLDKLYATSQLLSEITGVAVAPNKAVVGSNAFAHRGRYPSGRHPQEESPHVTKLSHPKKLAFPSGNWYWGKTFGPQCAAHGASQEIGYTHHARKKNSIECYKRVSRAGR